MNSSELQQITLNVTGMCCGHEVAALEKSLAQVAGVSDGLATLIGAGDIAAGEELLETLRPFVYRRYLDYTALDGLREMKAMIAAEVARKDMADDIKRGAGSIREIEFLAQVFQLIRGGREADLRDLNAELEARVQARTEDLEMANAELSARINEPITLNVTSDADDELHVHAVPEHEFEVKPGAAQRFEFTVDVPGRVEIELHHLNRTVAVLQVRP